MTKENPEPVALLGLLECPFRRGYIEFEYQPGDLTAELRKRVAQAWGPPVALGRELDSDNWHGGFSDRGLWAILCEDASGAYLSLKDDDRIPADPPKAATVVEPAISSKTEQEWNLPPGLVYDEDVAGRSLFFRENLGSIGSDKHLSLELNREYQIPRDRIYSVKLIALVVITGG